ncbi:undecaprenyldiphospho-muramoylpentapeptide beta-N-acetylglucosaminyltransferase [Leeia aquatica]|uniref:UDP-N-acetylglucosamine--N-acetylmuramyl-(pentapeptide) pyrophosphoryl-undecaprenol N-acetylglucosamine transferase n=1 Tax=Leeia aquatica TaxID=2725557 RepID=A0A847S7Q8_9NEIS|nr:undecaprenyldiphospho-muramoylpentapeptide beta-N-acetylglucosaminyltransferase [Leeia aquatica]NLR75047.1 undecaprenyldiphospho-muramoylpentapeptide beta-N-acetylglucosaminyltransferase [Leeia aquatica]
MSKTALIMAAGTGGHIFPALAVAQALQAKGWKPVWLGTTHGMENRLVAPHGYPMVQLQMQGVRGNGLLRKLKTPFMLLRAIWQARKAIRQHRPAVVVGFGGYVGFPGAVAAWLSGVPLLIHEQNAVAGLTNRVSARLAKRVLQAFPNVFPPQPKLATVGNPVRDSIVAMPEPAVRYADRHGPLQLLVVGGSQGAMALNQTVPAALASMPEAQRPQVVHQSGEKQIAALREHYTQAGVAAEAVPFIEDMATALQRADVVLCRAGALTVSELAAAGVAGIYVPLPTAVDDHQTANARFLTDAGAGWLLPQQEMTVASLARLLAGLDRQELQVRAEKARQKGMPQATQQVVAACEEVAR